MVILLLSLFVVLVSGSITLTVSHYRAQKNEAARQAAFYAAEACLEETRARVLTRLQAFINEGNANAEQFIKFLDALPSIIDEVTANETLQALVAESLTGNGSKGNNSFLFSYTAKFNDMSQTLYAEYSFDAPETFLPGDIAIDKVKIVWGK